MNAILLHSRAQIIRVLIIKVLIGGWRLKIDHFGSEKFTKLIVFYFNAIFL
jgi:hypothetical protein